MGETTIAEILHRTAVDHPSRTAFVFLSEDGLTERETRNYAQLDQEARAIAATLVAHAHPGDRVLLLYPPGLAFVSAFFGCLYAGLVPVPLYPPGRNQKLERVWNVVLDADARVALTTRELKQKLGDRWATELPDVRLTLLATDDPAFIALASGPGGTPAVSGENLAFLQYSSGSTGNPKGVMVSHANILHNARAIASAMDLSSETIGCSWLPVYHDMGLIGVVLETVFLGSKAVLMSPTHALQHPLSWLQLIGRYRATVSGGPNFMFDHCVRKFSPEACPDLDLSSWEVAFCGAEPVRAATARLFARTFAPYGFRHEAFYPCYGMAEATLFISGGVKDQASTILSADRDSLQLGVVQASQADDTSAEALELVGCGRPRPDMETRVVDPETLEIQADDRVGEIWLRGSSIAQGYWNATGTDSFQAFAADGSGPYLRTGDLGFTRDSEVFLTGRLKDVIIIRGRNHYPQDIEATVEAASPSIQPGRSTAFAIEQDEEERLVVVAEVQRQALRNFEGDLVARKIREAVAEIHGIVVSGVTLIKPGQLPVTSSGKVRRGESRNRYLARQLDGVFIWGRRKHDAENDDIAKRLAGIVAARPTGPAADPAPALSALSSRERADQMICWLRDFAGRRINSRLMDERRSLSPHVVLEFGLQGVFGMSIPERYHGLGLADEDTLRVVQQLGAVDISLSGMVGVHLALGVHPILHHAQQQLKTELLPQLAEGRMLAAFALTEPYAGSNPRALAATARAVAPGRWLLNGEKWWIGNGAWAGVVNVFARASDQAGNPLGVTGFVVDSANPALLSGEEAQTMGVRGMVQNAMHLRDAPIGESSLLGSPGNGMSVAQNAMNTGRLGIAAMSVGAMKRCIQLFYRYAGRRQINTGSLLQNPVTLHRLEFMTHAATAVESLVTCLARFRDRGKLVPEAAYAAVKVAGAEFAWQVVDWTVQGLGGRGYMENSGVPQMMRDIRLMRIFEGPTETLQMHLGQAILRQSGELQQFLGTDLGAAASARMLAEVLDEIRSAGGDKLGPFDEPLARQHWSAYRCGEPVQWAMLAAALEGEVLSPGDPARQEALEWAWHEFRLRAQTLLESRQKSISLAALSGRIEGFNQAIGDVEQSLPGMSAELDPLLRPASVFAPQGLAKPTEPPGAAELEAPRDTGPAPEGAAEIEAWLREWAAKELRVAAETIDIEKSISQHGLDSLASAELIISLEGRLGVTLQPDALWEQPSIRALAAYLATLSGTSRPIGQDRLTHADSHPSPQRVSRGTRSSNEREMSPKPTAAFRRPAFSLFFFGSEDGADGEKGGLILEAARRADEMGMEAVWTPERHFHPFGALFPNPAVLGAALAQATKRVKIRSGSVVLPLHHPLQVVEEWALVDKLSGGRVEMAVTPGWNPNDFVLAPETYATRMSVLAERLGQVRQLWRGESITLPNGLGLPTEVRTYPRPVQPELPLWLTCNRRREGFVEAGAVGASVLTGLLSQSRDQLAENIASYRRSLLEHGHDPAKGRVALMLHTFVGEDEDDVKALVRPPLIDYLRNSADLWQGGSERLENAGEEAREKLLEIAFERYFSTSALLGTVSSCRETIRHLARLGVDEIACLIDFGLPNDLVLHGLGHIEELARELDQPTAMVSTAAAPASPKALRPWLVTETPRPQGEMRLFCLPYAGGNARTFQGWGGLLPESIEVCAIDAPQSLDRLDALMDALLPALRPLLDRPFAFFGHSVGALIAFELSRRLRRDFGLSPRQVFVAAQHAPHLPFPHPAHAELSTPAGLAFLEKQQTRAGDSEENRRPLRLIERLGPGMRIQNEHYDWVDEPPLACPLTAIHGADDGLLARAQVEAWKRHSAG